MQQRNKKQFMLPKTLLQQLIHWENYNSISFQIEWDMIVMTVFLSILNQMEFHLVQNRKENCPHNHIPSNLKGNVNIVFSVYFFNRVDTSWDYLLDVEQRQTSDNVIYFEIYYAVRAASNIFLVIQLMVFEFRKENINTPHEQSKQSSY